MANANPVEIKKEEVMTEAATAVVNVAEEIDFAADAGAGLETAAQEDFAIPFLTVLQKMSPQVDEDSGAYIPGAKAGMIYETVTGRMFDGKKGVLIIPCAYRHVFLRWGPRESASAGFKGEFSVDAMAQIRASGQAKEVDGKLYAPLPDGSVHEKKSDRFADTRNHFCLLLDEENGGTMQVLLSISSTQIKKSKMLNQMLAAVRFTTPQGKIAPPTFGNLVRMTTVPEQNEKGTWHGIKFEIEGRVSDRAMYTIAKAFNASVNKGNVAARYDEDSANAGGAQAETSAEERF